LLAVSVTWVNLMLATAAKAASAALAAVCCAAFRAPKLLVVSP
jgi:hypothetical protein